MPRQARIDAPGVLHHIMIRGIERRKIFMDDWDREDFLDRLDTILPESQTACYAWAFLSNHAHFLFRTGEAPLAKVMRRLLTGYAMKFNRRHQRHGHLFQNRYKSIACREDAYLKELVRYIHLNPVRAGLVKGLRNLNCYPYSGHSALTGKQRRAWQDVDYVLACFGKTRCSAIQSYERFVSAGVELGRQDTLTGGGLVRSAGGWAEVRRLRKDGQDHVMSDERILGDSAFVAAVISQANERIDRACELKRCGYDVERIAERVAEIYGIEPCEVFSAGRQKQKVQVRSLFCFWAVRELGVSMRELAIRLKMSPPGVGYCVERGAAIARDNGYELMA